MNEPLTKKRALELCLEMWRWLEQNPKIAGVITGNGSLICDTKRQWPGFSRYGDMHCNCACCEFTKCGNPEDLDVDCSKCPTLPLWPLGTDDTDPLNACPCVDTGSVYDNWGNAVLDGDTKKCSEYAKVIADAAEAELKKLTEIEAKQ